MSITTDTTTDTTTANDTSSSTSTTTVLSGFNEMVASLHAAVTKSREANVASAIAKLRIMGEALETIKMESPSLESVTLSANMADLAFMTLPDDTRKALEASEAGNNVAMEIVRRNVTQLPTLAKTLYNATSEDLDADAGLRSLHGELASGLELYGALVAHGVNPRRRAWAKSLTDKFSSLSELRWLSWRRLMHILGMSETLSLEDPEGSDEEEPKDKKTEKAAALVVAVPVVRLPPALTRGEVHVLEILFSTGSGVPPIRKQALDFGLGLDAAGQMESSNIKSRSGLSQADIRTFQTKLKIPGFTEEETKNALNAMVSNKGQSATAAAAAAVASSDGDDDNLFGSYETNEALVAAAGGGMALYAINFFPNQNDVTLKPYAPILAMPTFVEMAGASASFEASVLHSTESSMASTYTKTAENGGISVALASSTSWGVSASVSGFASASVDCSTDENEKSDSTSNNAYSANNKNTTTSATTVETITCPMKSFRMPVSTMKMTEEALDSALQVDTLLSASQFLDTFGSHVSNGRHLLGGIFFRTMTMTAETEVDTSTLLAAASTQMQSTKDSAVKAEISASTPTLGISFAASASMGSATSSGVTTFHSSAGREENATTDCRAMYQTFVRSLGPSVATPELFAEALFTDTSSWAVIDRGPFEALLPITDVLENMLPSFDPASPGKTQLENAISLLTVAWQQRAAVWKHLENDPAVPASLRNMIGRSFAAEDAHDQIRAAVIDLFDILQLELEANTQEASDAISAAVIDTAKEMQQKPAGQADFFYTLNRKLVAISDDAEILGKFTVKKGTSEYQSACRSAKKLSSTDWAGFDLIWQKRMGNIAMKAALDNHLQFEQATLRVGESVDVDHPLTSINQRYILEINGRSLRVMDKENNTVVETLFQCDGTLGSSSSAHMDVATGAFVLDFTMTTGFDHTETKMVLWTAPKTEGNKGSYARMQNDGKFVVFNKKGKMLWST